MLLGGVGVGQQPGAGSSAGPARGDELSGPRRGAGGEAAAGRGAARRGRAAGGAVRGAAPRAREAWQGARAWLGFAQGSPAAGGRSAAPSRTMATDSKCARAVEAPGGRPQGPGVGSSPLCDACLYVGLSGPVAGVSLRPRRAPAPLPITLRYQAGLQRFRWSWQPAPEGCGRRMCAAQRWRGRCDAVGQKGLPSQPFGGIALRPRASLWGVLPPRRHWLLEL